MDNYELKDQFATSIRGLRIAMMFLGIWPRSTARNWYNSVWYIQSASFVFHIFGPIAGLIVRRHNARQFIDSLGWVIPTTFIFIKWITFATQRRGCEKILYSMKEDWKNLKNTTFVCQSVPASELIMAMYSRTAKKFFFVYMATMTIALITFVRSSIEVLSSHDNATNFEELLPIPNCWYPVDYNRRRNIQFLAVTQTITSTAFSLANATIDNFFVTVTLHLCGQLKILRYFIEGIKYNPSCPEVCATRVKLMVKRHQFLLRIADEIQDSYNFIILEQLVACTLSTCFFGYAFLAEIEADYVDSTALMKIAFTCIATLQAIFSYCFVGDSLSSHGLAVTMAAYNAQWYNSTRSISLSFLLVMIRAGRPIEITGAKLLSMSLENFTILIKAAASYLSVLRAVSVGEDYSK